MRLKSHCRTPSLLSLLYCCVLGPLLGLDFGSPLITLRAIPVVVVAAFSITTTTTNMRGLLRSGRGGMVSHLRAATAGEKGSMVPTSSTTGGVRAAGTSGAPQTAVVQRQVPRASSSSYGGEERTTMTAFQPKVKKEGDAVTTASSPSTSTSTPRTTTPKAAVRFSYSTALDPLEDNYGLPLDDDEDPYYHDEYEEGPNYPEPAARRSADLAPPTYPYGDDEFATTTASADDLSEYAGRTTLMRPPAATTTTATTATSTPPSRREAVQQQPVAAAVKSSTKSPPSSAPPIEPFLAPERDLLNKKQLRPAVDAFPTVEAYLEAQQITSRPKPDGNWNVQNPLGWAKSFGRRDPVYYENILKGIIKLQPGDTGYYDVAAMGEAGVPPDVTIVRTKAEAQNVLARLRAADPRLYHACDTEVMDVDLKSVGPVGNGYVTCVSIYSGPDFDYGDGVKGRTLWIDNLDDACGILNEFKEWFEDERYLKVWHNYGFDRHVMFNEGIDVKGFGGDTMHMARLQDTSRFKGYSLEDLTNELLSKKKEPMKELFGVKRLRKDGTAGLLVDCPPVEVLQRDPLYREKWIRYSAYDAKSTWQLRQKLEELLREIPWREDKNLFDYYWMHMRPFGEVLTDMERRGIRVAADDYLAKVEMVAREDRNRHDKAFREWAKKMIGIDGLAMNPASSAQLSTFLFGGAENPKTKERSEQFRVFSVPREDIPDDALEAMRLRDQAPKANEDGASADKAKAGTVEGLMEDVDNMKSAELKIRCKEFGLKVSGKKAELQERLKNHYMTLASKPVIQDDYETMDVEDLKDALIGRGINADGTREELIKMIRNDAQDMEELKQNIAYDHKAGYEGLCDILYAMERKNGALAELIEAQNKKATKVPKNVELKITSIGLQPDTFSAGGAASTTAAVLQKLAGDPYADPPRYGTALNIVGEEGCRALASLHAVGTIDVMIDNFLTSLQELADHESRVHCSLNLNTETGRLSSRRPNLQNQPALEKDKYKIRKAFQSSPGNNLIVADYGQLELRLLASMTECKSMIDAFAAGGDFHSRTAMDMFPHVKESLDSGECLLEWDYSKGAPPKPLLKDVYASERRKAKTLNFSIAYGKTAHGLSQDWGVSKQEAEEMLQAWYNARPEVRNWQEATKAYAAQHGITRTLMGRYRQLPISDDRKIFGGAQRASINTPIQGGAADIAMMAMIKINDSPKLKHLGWILLLQIHDEVIMEGPEETAEEAFTEVLRCMQEPWVFGLKPTSVPLSVDGSYTHKTWYDAK